MARFGGDSQSAGPVGAPADLPPKEYADPESKAVASFEKRRFF